MPPDDLIALDGRGLACPGGGFWVDPWKPVPRALITHAHADHARPGMGRYTAASTGVDILRRRLGRGSQIVGEPYGKKFRVGDVWVSFHPAGHCLGSAQIRVEGRVNGRERVAVIAGDYKRADDPTCHGFEVVPCDTFVTEATFALPIYRWRPGAEVADEILAWWDANRSNDRVSVVCAYALGKAQRLLGELAAACDRAGRERPNVRIHGALASMIEAYRGARGELPTIDLLPTTRIRESERARGSSNPFRGQLVLCPPGAAASPWIRRFGPPRDVSTAFASGWMAVRGVRRRRGYDHGFVISDHADWPSLMRTCRETGAARVLATHGRSDVIAQCLREADGIDAEPLDTAFGDEDAEAEATAQSGSEAEPESGGDGAAGHAHA